MGNMDKKRGCFLVLRKPLLFVRFWFVVCVRIVQFVGVFVFFLVVCFFLNSRTYAQGHTPTVIQGGRGGEGVGVNGTPS